jgi:hypothetical protein
MEARRHLMVLAAHLQNQVVERTAARLAMLPVIQVEEKVLWDLLKAIDHKAFPETMLEIPHHRTAQELETLETLATTANKASTASRHQPALGATLALLLFRPVFLRQLSILPCLFSGRANRQSPEAQRHPIKGQDHSMDQLETATEVATAAATATVMGVLVRDLPLLTAQDRADHRALGHIAPSSATTRPIPLENRDLMERFRLRRLGHQVMATLVTTSMEP